MSLLNPSLQNFFIQFEDDFFPEEVVKKYNDFLFHMNHPFKDIRTSFHESIQVVQVPGVNLAPLMVQGMDNTGTDPRDSRYNPTGFPHPTNNRAYEGNLPWWEVLESMILQVTFRNNILNWMYCWEIMYKRYLRSQEKRVNQFTVNLIMRDSAEIDMIKIQFKDCFITTMPSLEFAYNQTFNESKTFDVGIQANKIDVSFNIPDFKKVDFKKVDFNLYDKNNIDKDLKL